MFKNKLVMTMVIILLALTLIGGVAIYIVLNSGGDEEEVKEPTIDEIIENSVDIPEIATNLAGGRDFVSIQFKIQTDNKKAKAELEKRDFQIRNIIIQELSEMSSSEFNGRIGIENMENRLKLRLNELMKEGTIVRVYTTSFILQ